MFLILLAVLFCLILAGKVLFNEGEGKNKMTIQIGCTAGVDGYTCVSCGQWVPYGQEHHCYPTGYPTVTYNYPCCACFYQIQQLLEKVSRLIELLEKKEREKNV